MKTISKTKTSVVIALSLISASSFGQTISATSLTLDGAEAKIAAQARQHDDHYKILEASDGNVVHMTAELNK